MAVGTGGALEMCMTALCDRGQHILLPKPGPTLTLWVLKPSTTACWYVFVIVYSVYTCI